MAQLISPHGDYVALLHNTLVGTDRSRDLVLRNSAASGLQAQFGVQVERWFVQDMGSPNGTWLNGKRLAPHQRYFLSENDRLSFGHPSADSTRQWVVVDVAPPPPALVHNQSRELVILTLGDNWVPTSEGMAANGTHAKVTLHLKGNAFRAFLDGGQGQEPRELVDGGCFAVGCEHFKISLPLKVLDTQVRVRTRDSALYFDLTAEQTVTRAELQCGGKTLPLPSTAKTIELLLALGEERSRASQAGTSPQEAGYLTAPEAAAAMSTDTDGFFSAIHDIKKNFPRWFGPHLLNPQEIVEVRRGSDGRNEYRVGTAQLHINTADR